MPTSGAARLVAVPNRPKVVAPYERVSAVMGRDDDGFHSPDNQRRANLASIAAAGHVVYPDAVAHPERYRDIDRTGRYFQREGIQRLLDLKRRGEIGHRCSRRSRVGRTTSGTLALIDEFRGDGGVFLSSGEKIDDSPEGEWMLAIFASMAQLYSDRIADGWRAALRMRAESGQHNGRPPAGNRRERVDGGRRTRVVIDPATAPASRDGFRRYAPGETATSIEKDLLRLGIVANFGTLKPIILRNPFYVGDVRLFAYAGKENQRRKLADVPPFVAPGGHEPLLITTGGEPDRALFKFRVGWSGRSGSRPGIRRRFTRWLDWSGAPRAATR